MPIGIGTSVRMAYIEESTHGTTPTTPTLKVLRTIGRNMNRTKRTIESQETQAHGQIQDLRHGFEEVGGAIAVEWGLQTLDDMLQSLMGNTWASDVLRVGTAVRTFTFERQFLDLSKYEVFRGVSLNSADFKLQPEGIVGATLNFLGMTGAAVTGSTIASGLTAAPTTQPFDTFTGTILEGGSPIATVTGMNLQVARNQVLVPVIGAKTSPDVFQGTCKVTGTLTAMFQDEVLLNKFLNESISTLSLQLNDPDNLATKSVVILLPRIKYLGNTKDPAREGPVIQNAPFQALYDQTEQTSIKITRDLV